MSRGGVGVAAVALVATAVGCGGTRQVAGAEQPAVARAGEDETAAAGVADAASEAETAPAPEPPPVDGAAAAHDVDPATLLDSALRPALLDETRAAERRGQFGRAVALISAQLGAPISAEQALRDMPCGGWSAPDCPNLTAGMEIVQASAPTVASFHGRRTADIVAVLPEAVSLHAVWHDAYGYVRRVKKKGPGYTYAGCLFSRCDAENVDNGQVDGVLYQVGRLLGKQSGPPCGPSCQLADP
jgi:hypothetical protein